MSKQYKVKQGDCMLSIAEKHGFFWETVWDHADNAALKEKRENSNELAPGDVVAIPDKREKDESKGATKRHRFKKKGVPAMLRLRIEIDDEAMANEPYRLTIDGRLISGTTDGDGRIEEPIPPNAVRGELRIGRGDEEMIYPLQLGTLDPLDTENGVRGRLRCLGYDGEGDLAEAIREFQGDEGLEATGTLDEPTKQKLVERFGQ